jgi:ABC-type branched-subunit amino acid transport system ATPase component
LSVDGVVSGYGETEILHGVTMHVDSGEIVTIIGPNGAGKSTLIKTVIGILKARKGKILFAGQEITGKAPEHLVLRGLAYVPQMSNIFPSLSVYENLEMGAVVRRPGWLTQVHRALLRREGPPKYSQDEFRAQVDHVMTLFPNLKPKLREKASLLSGGEQQMVALAKTLMLNPTLLLIDEPSAGLAPKLVQTIFEKVVEINSHGTAIVLVEQNAKRALEIAHRGYVLEMGRNRFEGKGEALLQNPEVGRLYLGR